MDFPFPFFCVPFLSFHVVWLGRRSLSHSRVGGRARLRRPFCALPLPILTSLWGSARRRPWACLGGRYRPPPLFLPTVNSQLVIYWPGREREKGSLGSIIGRPLRRPKQCPSSTPPPPPHSHSWVPHSHGYTRPIKNEHV